MVSRTLLKRAAGTITLFAFDEGQSLSEHTSQKSKTWRRSPRRGRSPQTGRAPAKAPRLAIRAVRGCFFIGWAIER